MADAFALHSMHEFRRKINFQGTKDEHRTSTSYRSTRNWQIFNAKYKINEQNFFTLPSNCTEEFKRETNDSKCDGTKTNGNFTSDDWCVMFLMQRNPEQRAHSDRFVSFALRLQITQLVSLPHKSLRTRATIHSFRSIWFDVCIQIRVYSSSYQKIASICTHENDRFSFNIQF